MLKAENAKKKQSQIFASGKHLYYLCTQCNKRGLKHEPMHLHIPFQNIYNAITMNRTIKHRQTLFCLTLLTLLVHTTSLHAQVKVADKEIIGVWVMTSMKYKGESRNFITDKYTQVKVYRSNGEYACAEVVNAKGTYVILPHEYGTYSLKNGQYTEMGRPSGTIEWVDKEHTRGHWFNRMDAWKKVKNMPETLTQYIVDKCKAHQSEPESIQKLTKKYIFNK